MTEPRSNSSLVHHRHMPDDYMYELRRGGEGWEARRQEGEQWDTARSAAFALVGAYGGDGDPHEFGRAARDWERELRR